MNCAVNLDNQISLSAEEINDKPIYRMLTAKLYA